MLAIITCTAISPADLSALDLRAEAVPAHMTAGDAAYRLEVEGHAQRVEVLVMRPRAGVACGADAVWIDLHDDEGPEDAARIVMTDAAETDRRR